MPTPRHRSRRQSPEMDDIEDDDYSEGGNARQVGQEKMKLLMLDLLGRWHWIVLGLILGVLGAFYALSKIPKQYTATSSLLIKQQTASVMARDQIEEIDMRSIEAMNTVAERIRRMDLMERVGGRQDVRSLAGLMPPEVDWTPEWLRTKMGKNPQAEESSRQAPPSASSLGGMIASWLNVSIRRNTRLIDLSITHPVPEVAKALADAVAREYLAEITSARTETRSGSIELLEKESKSARNNLQSARSALTIYARAIEVHKTLETKENEAAVLQRRYLAKHPKMKTATAELKELQDQFITEFENARQSAIDKSYWDVAAKEMPDSQTHPEEYLRKARQQLVARIGVLESEIQSATLVFNSMLTRIKEASVNQESVEANVEISNLARLPGMPSAPVPNKIFGIGGAGGLAAGLLLALFFIRLDNKYHTVTQLAGETGVTVLAAIADIRLHHLAVAERDHRKQFPDDKAGDYHKNWDPRLVFRVGTGSTSYAEMYRVLRASVSLLGDETKRKITLFSSALPGEGKTSTSANFALAAAAQGRKTLLIDLDLRKPSIYQAFGLSRDQDHIGITECLANKASFEEAIIRETGQENLHIVLAGMRAPNPGELLEAGRLGVILDQACALYDCIVIDSAPLLAVSDTRIIAPLAHNFCLVVRAEYVPKGAVRRVLQILDEDGVTLSGVVFNGFKEKRFLIGQNHSYGYYKTSRYGRSYGYGYGAYGTYGSDRSK